MLGKLFPHQMEDNTRDPYIPNKLPQTKNELFI